MTIFLHRSSDLFMQPPKTSSQTRKPWYERVIKMATLWKPSPKVVSEIPSQNNITLWRSLSKTQDIPSSNPSKKLRKSTSLKGAATSFTRVCLCAPMSSYTEFFQADVPPRRSYSYPRTKHSSQEIRTPSARMNIEGRRIFRGKSLTDNVLMRRFVIEEEAMMQVKRRNQMEIIRKRSSLRKKKIGPSPLSRMSLAEE